MRCPECGGPSHEDGICPERHAGANGDLHTPTLDLPLGSGIFLEGRYRLGRLIARGGMGEVFEGYDTALKRAVAIKFLAARYGADPELSFRFRREAEALASLEHPGVVPVYSVGVHEGRPYFVMKRLRGRALDSLIRASAPLPLAVVVHLGTQVCAGLDRIHRAGYVHRDIKPANLFVDEEGSCTILDFGILRESESQLTGTGLMVGTPHYMAPEQGRDARLATASSDLYSLGATLYTALTGGPPFDGDSAYEIVNKHHDEPLDAPSRRIGGLSRNVDQVFLRALAKNPDERYPDAASMREALLGLAPPRWTGFERVAGGSTAADTLVQGELIPAAATTHRARRRRRLLALGAAGLVVALAAVLLAVDPFGAASPQRTPGASRSAEEGVGATARPIPPLRPPVSAPSVNTEVHTLPAPKPPPPPRRVAATGHVAPSAAVGRAHRTNARRRRRARVARTGPTARPRQTTRTVGRTAVDHRVEPAVAGSIAPATPTRPDRRVTPPPPPVTRPAVVRIITLHQGRSIWATISIDGKPAGTSPIAKHSLDAGRHLVVASRPGYHSAQQRVDLASGEQRKLILKLERESR